MLLTHSINRIKRSVFLLPACLVTVPVVFYLATINEITKIRFAYNATKRKLKLLKHILIIETHHGFRNQNVHTCEAIKTLTLVFK